MKAIKYFFFLVLLLIIGGAIYFGAKDGSYDISDTVELEAPPEVVFTAVNEYKTWPEWGPWKEEDPTMTFSFPEKTSGTGASYSWEGEMSGDMTTTGVVPNQAINQDLHLVTPAGDRYPEVYWTFKPTPSGGTEVTWGMKGEHPFMDKLYYALSGMDFEGDMHTMNTKGLQGLQTYTKELMEARVVTINGITEYGGGFYLYKSSSASSTNISDIMAQNYGELMSFMSDKKIYPAGMPLTVYNEMTDTGVIMSNGLPVQNKVIVTGDSNILCGYLPKTKVLKVTLKGNYTYLQEAWQQGMKHISEEGLEQSSDKPFEIYQNDPGQFPNPADWITEIYIPVK